MKCEKIYYNLLLILLVSTSIYRIDLGLGFFFFKVTPVLFFSLLLLCILTVNILKSFSFKIKFHEALLLYIGFLLASILISLYFNSLKTSIDFLQIARLVLFSLMLFSAFGFIYFFDKLQKFNQYKLLSQFIDISLTVYAIFSLIEIYFFFQGKTYLTEENQFLHGFISPYPQSIGSYFPRLTGGFVDPNIASYFLTFLFFLSCLLNKNKAKNFSFLFIVLTLSRSGIAGFVLGIVFYKIMIFLTKKRKFVINFLNLFKKVILLVLVFGVLYILKNYIYLLISIRLGSDLYSGSGKTHVELIIYALSKLNSIPSILFGYGFNSSYLFAQKFFPGSKYANFHSEYITFLFEEGIIGLFIYLTVYLIIFYYGILNITKNKLFMLSLSVSFMLFNIFYQQFIFLYYWIGLFLIVYLLSRKNLWF